MQYHMSPTLDKVMKVGVDGFVNMYMAASCRDSRRLVDEQFDKFLEDMLKCPLMQSYYKRLYDDRTSIKVDTYET